MKNKKPPTLFTHQETNSQHNNRSLDKYGVAIDTSVCGAGKTHTFFATAELQGASGVTIIGPKPTALHWNSVANDFGYGPYDMNFVTWQKAARDPNFMPPENHLCCFDEMHRGKGANTLQAKMMARVGRARKSVFSSATPFASPMETRALLHATGLVDWTAWYGVLKNFGCYQDTRINNAWRWNGNMRAIEMLRDMLLPMTVRTDFSQIPEFNDLRVTVRKIAVGNTQQYSLRECTARATADNPNAILGAIQRMRVKNEKAKVWATVELMKDALEQGVKPILFGSYNEPLTAVADKLGAWLITGETPDEERDQIMTAFQKGKTLKALVVNQACGGEGVNMHDEEGIPRRGFIWPNWSAQDLTQVCGRTHRVGAKSPATYELLFANATIEDAVADSLKRKLTALETLSDSDLDFRCLTKPEKQTA